MRTTSADFWGVGGWPDLPGPPHSASFAVEQSGGCIDVTADIDLFVDVSLVDGGVAAVSAAGERRFRTPRGHGGGGGGGGAPQPLQENMGQWHERSVAKL